MSIRKSRKENAIKRTVCACVLDNRGSIREPGHRLRMGTLRHCLMSISFRNEKRREGHKLTLSPCCRGRCERLPCVFVDRERESNARVRHTAVVADEVHAFDGRLRHGVEEAYLLRGGSGLVVWWELRGRGAPGSPASVRLHVFVVFVR